MKIPPDDSLYTKTEPIRILFKTHQKELTLTRVEKDNDKVGDPKG